MNNMRCNSLYVKTIYVADSILYVEHKY
jgi:hypothetical protein